MKKTKKRIVSIFLSAVMVTAVFLTMPMTVLAAGHFKPDVSVNNETDLRAEVTSASETTAATPKVIEIAASFDITAVIQVPVGEHILLVSNGNHTLTTQGKYRHFLV